MDVDAITSVAQDYVKAVWTATEWGGPPVTTKALAERFGTSQANVTETVKRLAGQGLLTYERYRPVVLTSVGTDLAVAMVRRHRLIETFLVRVLGYGWDEVHDEAERLEHAASDLLIDRVDRLLGHPAADPHGDPIPDSAGRVSRPSAAVRLVDATDGPYVVERLSDANAEDLAWASGVGVRPSTVLSVVHEAGGLVARVDDADETIPVPPGPARSIWVSRRSDEPAH